MYWACCWSWHAFCNKGTDGFGAKHISHFREGGHKEGICIGAGPLFVCLDGKFLQRTATRANGDCLPMGAIETRRGQRDGYVFETPLKG